jgi:uncharacterized membrane protein YqaE (UPF0057 family)
MKNVKSVLKIAIAAVVLSSCSSVNGLFYNGKLIQKRNAHEEVSDLNNKSANDDVSEIKNQKDALNNEDQTSSSQITYPESNDVATASNDLIIDQKVSSSYAHATVTEPVSRAQAWKDQKVKSETVIQRKEFSHKDYKKSMKDDVDKVLIIVLCFLIPPLAVYLFEGSWTDRCTINLILTLLCGLPGVIHALLVVLK